MEIEETYKNMDETKRDELTTLVKERVKREVLFIGPGDLEAAVVRMYERSLKLSRPLGNNPDAK